MPTHKADVTYTVVTEVEFWAPVGAPLWKVEENARAATCEGADGHVLAVTDISIKDDDDGDL